jgi:hypothetical protein
MSCWWSLEGNRYTVILRSWSKYCRPSPKWLKKGLTHAAAAFGMRAFGIAFQSVEHGV